MQSFHVPLILSLFLTWIQNLRGYNIPLTGKWNLTDNRITATFKLNTTFGTDVLSVLQAGGISPNPLIGYGDTVLRPISYRNWTYSHYFYLSYSDAHKAITLELDELDTFCCVHLNNRRIICTDNSFIRTSISVSPWIRQGWNFLQLNFKSTPLMAKSAYWRLSPNPPPPECWPSIFKGECHVNAVRTTQASFGWDWGPAFPIQGFWKIPALRYGKLWLGDGLRFYPIRKGSLWKAAVSVEVVGGTPNRKVCVHVKLDGGLMDNWGKRCYSAKRNRTSIWMELPLTGNTSVTPWWPLGIRSGPHLYALTVRLLSYWGGYPVDGRSFWVGFRQVELVQDNVTLNDQLYGKTFYFRINGEAIFVRGGNWIPATLFPAKKSGQGGLGTVREAELLHSAAQAGIQMLRVWGGGRYEDRRFYDLAGHLGIMIWQDMMFACAMYKKPANGEPDSVETEIRQQVRRLHHHPSIVIWATNNEVEVAAAQGWYGPNASKIEYRRRFLDSVAKIMMKNEGPSNRSIGYIPRQVLFSSPSNAAASTDTWGIDSNPQDPLAGDVHFYTYSEDLWDECTYPVSRFTSEYGIMSLPGPLAWLHSLDSNSAQPDDWEIRGRLMMHRLHKQDGIDILQRYVLEKFGKPRMGQSKEETYNIWVYLTQLYQAIAYKTHINLLERYQCKISDGTSNDDCYGVRRGQGRSMGHLYWQLNDVWAAPTWSTVDVTGHWKIAHYLAIRGTSTITHPLGRILVSRVRDHVLINWTPPVNQPTEFLIHIYILCPSIASFDQSPTILFKSSDTRPWQPNGCPREIANFLMNRLLSKCPSGVLETVIDNGHQQINDTVLLLTPKEIKQLWSKNAGSAIVESVERADRVPHDIPRPPFRWNQVFKVGLHSEVPELYVWLVVDAFKGVDGWFSDNAFSMMIRNKRTVFFFTKGTVYSTIDELKNCIRVYSLGSVLPRK